MMAIFKTTLLMVVLLLAYVTQLTVAQNVQSIDDNDQENRSDAYVKLENPTKATSTKTPTTTSPLISCPSQRELSSNRCICFTNTRTLLCSHFTGSFALTNHYQLERLVIAYSDHTDLSMLTQLITSKQLTFGNLLIQNNRLLQRIDPQLFQIITDNITIAGNSNLELIEYSNHTNLAVPTQFFRNLEIQNNLNLKRIDSQLIQIITDKLRIVNNPYLESIDWSQLQPLLSSIWINSVKSLLNFDPIYKTFPILKKLYLDNLHFGSPDSDSGSNLTIGELQFPALKSLYVHSTNLGGTVRIAMTDKSHEFDEYSIDIQYNEKLSYFDFGALFPSNTSESVSFNVILSFNKNINPKLLIDQLSVLDQHAAHITAYLEEVPLDCNCDLYKLYNDFDPVNENSFSKKILQIYCANHNQSLDLLPYDAVC